VPIIFEAMRENIEASQRIEAARSGNQIQNSAPATGGVVVYSLAKEEFWPNVNDTNSFDWVKYGWDNLYPDKVLEWAEASPIHSSIVKTKADRTAGDGFIFSGPTTAIDSLLNSPDDEDLEETRYRSCFDYVMFGGFYLQVTWDSLEKPEKIVRVKHLDFSAVRCAKANPNTGEIENFWVSKCWRERNRKGNKPQKFPAFGLSRTEENRTQIIYIKRHYPGMYYYPVPDYSPAIKDIKADGQLQSYRLNNISNGFLPSTVVGIPGDPGPDARKEVKKNLTEQYSGPENAGKFMLIFSPNPENPITVTPLDNKQNANVYANQKADINQNIFSAHRLSSPVIAGVPGSGSLGGNASEIRDANEVFHNTVIKRYQKDVLRGFKKVFRQNGYMGEVTIDNAEPIAFKFSDQILMQILDKNELRELIGYEPTTEVLSNLTPAQLKRLREGVEILLKEKEKGMAVAFATAKLKDGGTVFIDEESYEAFHVIDGNDRAEKMEDGDYELENGATINIREGLLVTGSAGAIPPVASFLNRYKYSGPNDSKNREFCKDLLLSDKTYSLYEIQAMSAVRGYDVWADCGGANCRHKWVRASK
jgi:hypothetical protein